jgi:hypothetical protein
VIYGPSGGTLQGSITALAPYSLMHDVGDDVVLPSAFCFAVREWWTWTMTEAMKEAVGDSRGDRDKRSQRAGSSGKRPKFTPPLAQLPSDHCPFFLFVVLFYPTSGLPTVSSQSSLPVDARLHIDRRRTCQQLQRQTLR